MRWIARFISVVALRIASEGREIAIVLKEIQDAMDAAFAELSRQAPISGFILKNNR